MEEKKLTADSVHLLSSWELISVYINKGAELEPSLRSALERELSGRRLPLPEPTPPEPAAKPANPPMSRETFLSYLLLIYTMTGLFYAWFYLPMRLIRGDFQKDLKHRIIQTGIATAYQAAELGAWYCLFGPELIP